MSKGHEYKEMFLKPSILKVDYSYQRNVPDKEVKAILNKWNYDTVNMPKVSQREDGSLYIVDGQHTVMAWKAHENDAPIRCKVFAGLTWNDEVQMFLDQFGVDKDVTSGEMAKARYNRKAEEDLDIVGTVDAAKLSGITVSFYPTNSKNATNAIVACVRGYKRLGTQKFSEALAVLKNAWDGDHAALSATFINGIVELFAANYAEIDRDRLIKALSKNSPSYYVQRTSDFKGNRAKSFALVLSMVYNSTRHSQKLSYTA